MPYSLLLNIHLFHFSSSCCLCCSVAILKYLVQKYSSSVAEHWYPADLQQRARVNEYLSWQHMNLRAHGSKVFLLRVRVPDQPGVVSIDLLQYTHFNTSYTSSFVSFSFLYLCILRLFILDLYLICLNILTFYFYEVLD